MALQTSCWTSGSRAISAGSIPTWLTYMKQPKPFQSRAASATAQYQPGTPSDANAVAILASLKVVAGAKLPCLARDGKGSLVMPAKAGIPAAEGRRAFHPPGPQPSLGRRD